MAWLRKGQSIPAFPTSPPDVNDDVRAAAFLDFIGGKPYQEYPEPNFVNNASYGFDKNELVYACIMEKASSLPEAPIRVYGADGQGEPRENHPLRQLIANPNPACTEFELIELTSIYLDLAGVAFWEIVRDRAGRPTELWPLRPDLVRFYAARDGNHHYSYQLNGQTIDLGTDVLKFTLPNPVHPWLGQAPMRPANRAVALDNEATDFVKTLLQNRAIPGAVILTEQRIDEELTERLTAKWMQRFGKGNRGAPAFLQKGMDVKPLGLDLGQLEFPDLRTISESRICMSFGVPPILVGAKVGLDRSTFANYAEARRSFWEETLMPLQKRLQQVIVSRLMPQLEGPRPRRSVARFDNSQVLALRESEGRRWELATQALRSGGITINQFNRYVGIPSVPDGDVYLRPAGVIPTDVVGNVLAEHPAITLVANGSNAEEPADQPEPVSDDESDVEDPKPNVDTGDGKASPVVPSHKQVAAALRDDFTDAIIAVVAQQREDVLDKISSAKALLEVAPDRFRGDVWDREKWNRLLADAMEPHMLAVARTAARKVDDGTPVALMDSYVNVVAAGAAARWNDETAAQLKTALDVGGGDVDENVDNVFAIAGGYRATRLSQSVATDMNGFAKVDTAKRAGLTAKTWRAGENSRPEHAALDGETVALGQPFSNGDQWPTGFGCNCDVDCTSEGI